MNILNFYYIQDNRGQIWQNFREIWDFTNISSDFDIGFQNRSS